MNSIYEWQKFETHRKIDGYMRQADAHRQAKRQVAEEKGSHFVTTKLSFASIISIVLLVIGFLLTG